LPKEGYRIFEYFYEYRDNWRIALVLEAIPSALPGIVYAGLVEGACRGPPEDVGGPSSYSDFLEAIVDPICQWRAESPHLWRSKIPQFGGGVISGRLVRGLRFSAAARDV
jgi:hypothetical protein